MTISKSLSNLTKEEDELLQKVSIEARAFYLAEINKLALKNNSLDFDLSSLGSRDPYLSPLYEALTELLFYLELLKKKSYPVIQLKHPQIHRTLSKFIKRENISTKIISYPNYKSKLILLPLRFIKSLTSLMRERSLAKKHSVSLSDLRKVPFTFVDTFITQSLFKNGYYQDRYYNNFGLRENPPTPYFFLPTFAAISNYGDLALNMKGANKENHFFFKEKILKLSDYIYAFCHFYRVRKLDWHEIQFNNLDLSPIFKNEISNSRFNDSTLKAFLNFRFTRRLKELNISPRLLINWSENQVVDKGLVFGFNQYRPETKLKAYQAIAMDPIYNFHLFPTLYEMKRGLFPKTLCLTGKTQALGIPRVHSELKVELAPAYRYQISESKRLEENCKNILVALPIFKGLAQELLDITVQASKDNHALNFNIKCHPANIINFQESTNLINVTKENTQELIYDSSIVITSVSSICFDAIQAGRPVLILRPKGVVFQNPLPSELEGKIFSTFTDKRDFSLKLNFFLDKSKFDNYLKISKDFTTSHFVPITKENTDRFLDIYEA